jgi:hypothetical protein
VIEHDQPISEGAAAKIKIIRQQQREDKRIVMPPADVSIALGVGDTRVRELLAKGEISSILDGKLRRVIVASVYDYLVRRAIESNPIDGTEAKVRAFLGKRPQERVTRKGKAASSPDQT